MIASFHNTIDARPRAHVIEAIYSPFRSPPAYIAVDVVAGAKVVQNAVWEEENWETSLRFNIEIEIFFQV
jgi:hypothetical protein